MSVLVLAEHNNKELRPSSYNTISAASQISSEIDVIFIGYQGDSVVDDLKNITLVKKILQLDSPIYEHLLAEDIVAALQYRVANYSHILAPATAFGKNIMPRLAAMLDVAQISDIISIESADTFIRPIYAGNALALIRSTDNKKVITIRPTSFEAADKQGGNAVVEKINNENQHSFANSSFISREESKSERPELTTAKIVVSGGRGLQSLENFAMIYQVADKLNAAVGASRAAVDAGYVTNDFQVGQTGKVVVPDLYIAIGISGAIQHLAGMRDSRVIVAINNDADAPIFNVADYGLCVDLFNALPQLLTELDIKVNIKVNDG